MTRTALVTGGARRVGKALCLALARQGYIVVVHYRSSAHDAHATKAECLAAGAPAVHLLQADLETAAGRASVMPMAANMLGGPPDLLVNSASAFEYDDAQSFDAAHFAKQMQTNFIAPVELAMALHAQSVAAHDGRLRHVVTLLDQKVSNLNTDYLSYTLAKLASAASIRMLAQSLAPAVRVNAISPGLTLLSGDMHQAEFAQAHQVAALGRSSTPDDLAVTLLFLDQCAAVTGQTLAVDGGQHLVPLPRDVAFIPATEASHAKTN